MIKVDNGVEYLDYDQAASEYSLSRNSIPPMVSRGVFSSKKFPNIVNKFISRNELEEYKHRKDKAETIQNQHEIAEEERSTQDVPFPLERRREENIRRAMENERIALENERTTRELMKQNRMLLMN